MMKESILVAEMQRINNIFAKGFEEQIYKQYVNAIKSAIAQNKVHSKNLELVPNLNLDWECSSKADLRDLNDAKKVVLDKLPPTSSNANTEESNHLNIFSETIQNMKGIEYDVLIFVCHKQNPEINVELILPEDRDVKVKTPFCLMLEITLTGARSVLEQKIMQLVRQMFFLKECTRMVTGQLGPHGSAVKPLIDNGKMNIYPFIIVDGDLKRQHFDFNDLHFCQRDKFLKIFRFYNMIRTVKQSSTIRPESPVYRVRYDNEYAIDLMHFFNEYDSKNLNSKIEAIESKTEKKINQIELLIEESKKNNAKNYTTLDTKIEDTKQYLDNEISRLKNVLEKQISSNQVVINTRFESIEKRIEGVEKRIEGVEKRIEGVEKRIEGVEKRIEEVEKRIETVEKRLESMQNEINGLTASMQKLRTDLNDSNKRMDRKFNTLMIAIFLIFAYLVMNLPKNT